MESQEVLKREAVLDESVVSVFDGSGLVGGGGKENEDFHFLRDFELYMDDINDRLMISRMVSDSVIKGIVSAVEKEAADKIAAKELEMAGMKEALHFQDTGMDKTGWLGSPLANYESESLNHVKCLSFTYACAEHDKIRESLGRSRIAVGEQFKKLKKEIYGVRSCSSIRRTSSSSELVGLGGILEEKAPESWVGVDRTLDALKMIVDTICNRVDDMLQISKTSLCEWHQEQEFKGELEGKVMQSFLRSVQEEFQDKLWDQSAHLCDGQSVNWVEKLNEMSSLCKELDAILKSLSDQETSQLMCHGLCDIDHFHGKALSDHISPPTSICEGNGKLHDSKTELPENFDVVQLKHMPKDDMMNYFTTMITKVRRDHDSKMQELTEKYFSLKREYYNLRSAGHSLPYRRSKEFDTLKKKIPEVILKVDDILLENEKIPMFCENVETLGSLKDRIDGLLHENHLLRDSLANRKNEVEFLSSQVSDAADTILQHSVAETNLQKLIRNLNSTIEDTDIQASVGEEVYKCILREMSGQIKCDTEESKMEFTLMQEICGIVLKGAIHDIETTCSYDIEDSNLETLIMQGVCGIIVGRFINDAERKLKELYAERKLIEEKALIKESEFRSEVEEKERLKQEVVSLSASVEEKEKLAWEASAALKSKREQFELASQELNMFRDQTRRLELLFFQRGEELDSAKGELLAEVSKQIEKDEIEIIILNAIIEQAIKELKEADEQKSMFLSDIQEKRNDLLLVQIKEKEHEKQLSSLIVIVNELSKALSDFECKVSKDIKMNHLRLEHSSSELSSLIKKANILRRTRSQYKQRLERKCANLQMAEAEVDLLGDEVDTLLGLLEKIYIALDHYSPILQHYPGIVEILKLVRSELSGESSKQV